MEQVSTAPFGDKPCPVVHIECFAQVAAADCEYWGAGPIVGRIPSGELDFTLDHMFFEGAFDSDEMLCPLPDFPVGKEMRQ